MHLKDLLAGVAEERRWVAEHVYGGGAVLEDVQREAVRRCGATVEEVEAGCKFFNPFLCGGEGADGVQREDSRLLRGGRWC